MPGTTSRALACPLLALAVLSLFPALASAAETTVFLKNIRGAVEISPGNRGEWMEARPAIAMKAGDAVRTGADGSALLLHGPSELFIKPNTTAVLGFQSVQLREGTLWFRMRKTPTGFKFITDVAAATIRGTLGQITARPDVTTVSLLKGKVEIDTPNENYMLYPQYEVVARRRKPLEKSAMSGSRLTSLVGEFYGTAKSLGGATGSGAGPRGAPTLEDLRGDARGAGDAKGAGLGVFDPAAARSASSASVQNVVPGLITVVDNTTNPTIQTLSTGVAGAVTAIGSTVDSAVSGVGSTVGGVVGGVTGGTTTLVGGVTGGTTTLVGGVTGGTTTLVGGVTGGTTTLIGGVTGGTTTLIGGVTGGTTTLIGGVTGGTTTLIGGATGGTTTLIGGTTGGTGSLLGGGTPTFP